MLAVTMPNGSGGAGSTQGSLPPQPGASLKGFVSSELVAAQTEAERSLGGLKICFAASDGNSGAWVKTVPVIHVQQPDSIPAHFSQL